MPVSPAAPASTRPGRIPPAAPRAAVVAGAAVLDLALVVVFAAVGRASHREADALAGLATTAWPFAAGALAGWLLVRAWRAPLRLSSGAGVWLATVIGGVALRVVTGGGAPVSFIVVTAIVLAVFLLGWRGVAALVRRLTGRGPHPHTEGA